MEQTLKSRRHKLTAAMQYMSPHSETRRYSYTHIRTERNYNGFIESFQRSSLDTKATESPTVQVLSSTSYVGVSEN